MKLILVGFGHVMKPLKGLMDWYYMFAKYTTFLNCINSSDNQATIYDREGCWSADRIIYFERNKKVCKSEWFLLKTVCQGQFEETLNRVRKLLLLVCP